VPFDAESTPMYNPTSEQADIDRQSAYEAGVPHGEPAVNPALTCTHSASASVHSQNVPKCLECHLVVEFAGLVAPGDKYKDLPMVPLRVVSELVSASAHPCTAAGWQAKKFHTSILHLVHYFGR